MSREVMVQLAARHQLNEGDLIEAWSERAAIREHVAGFSRRAAELWAVGDVEAMYQIGVHCPESIRRWTAPAPAREKPPRGRKPAHADTLPPSQSAVRLH